MRVGPLLLLTLAPALLPAPVVAAPVFYEAEYTISLAQNTPGAWGEIASGGTAILRFGWDVERARQATASIWTHGPIVDYSLTFGSVVVSNTFSGGLSYRHRDDGGFFIDDAVPMACLPGDLECGSGELLGGIFTVTESAAMGAGWAVFCTALLYRELTWEGFVTAVAQSVRTTSVVLLLVGTASGFAYLLALHRVPEELATAMLAISENPVVLMLMINLALLVLGCIMDMAALILICTPIFLPVATQIGLDPVQFGMVMMMNLGLGLTTPPVGAVLFVGCAIARVKIESVMRTIWPFYAAILAALALTTYWSPLSLTLPRAVLGYGG